MQSETIVGAVPAAADVWNDIGTVVVPAGVKRLMKLRAGIAPAPGALAQVHTTPVIRLIGAGLLEQNPHEFVCQGVNMSITAANTGGFNAEPNVFGYDLDIEVATGGQITVQANYLDEIVAALTMRVELDYDEKAPTAKNQMAQYVDAAAPVAANAWTLVGTLNVPQVGEGKSPTGIREIVCGIVPDVAGNALLRNSARFRLSGSGLKEGGLHQFLSTQMGVMWTTPGAQGSFSPIVRIPVDLPVNAGGQILVEAISDIDLQPATSTAVLGVLYY